MAARLFGAVAALVDTLGCVFGLPERERFERAAADARHVLGDAAFAAELAVGRALSLDQPSAALIEELDAARGDELATSELSRSDVAGAKFGLTPRERQVLRLTMAGGSDRAIGDALSISRNTASKHVTNILAKLGVGSRTAAAALAHQRGLG